MKKGKMATASVLCIFILLFSRTVFAETVTGDLSERFRDQITLQYEGKDYRVRQRLTTMLFLGMVDDTDSEEQEKKAAFVGILVVDDDAKTIAMIQIPSRTAVQLAYTQVLVGEVYGMFGGDQGCVETLDAINSVFPEALIENYLALDMAGLNDINGFEAPDTQGMEDEEAVKTCLKALKAYVEEDSSSDDMNEIITTLSGYTITEMKTGALMKIANKAERYEILPTFYLAGSYVSSGAEEIFIPDEIDLTQQLIEIFYEESFW